MTNSKLPWKRNYDTVCKASCDSVEEINGIIQAKTNSYIELTLKMNFKMRKPLKVWQTHKQVRYKICGSCRLDHGEIG